LRKSGEMLGQLRKMTLYVKWTSFSYGFWKETCMYSQSLNLLNTVKRSRLNT